MKKVIIAVIAIAIIAAAVFFGLKMVPTTKEAPIANIVPGDVAFYYSIQNLETIWNNIKTSNFWMEISGLQLWEDIQVTSGLTDIQNQFKDNIGIELSEANFLKLAGKELVIAISPAAEQDTPPQILILTRGGKEKDLSQVIAPIVGKVKESTPEKIAETQYSGITITHIKADSADQPEIYFALIKDVLAIGIGDAQSSMEKVIDLSTGKATDSLAAAGNYKKMQGLIGPQKQLAALFYMDFSEMKQYLQGLKLPGPEGTETELATGMDTLSYIGGWTEIKDGLITKLYIYPNAEALTPQMKEMWQAQPQVPGTLKFIPENILLYLVSNTIDVKAMWNLWQENLKKQAPEQTQPILDAISNFEKEWDINIETDVIPLLKNEIAFIFADISTQGFIPLPKLALALKIADKVKVDNFISDLIATNNEKATATATRVEALSKQAAGESPPQEEESATPPGEEPAAPPALSFQIDLQDELYDGNTIKTVQLPLIGTGLSPGYTYIDDFLVIGASTKTLQELIDVTKGKVKPLTQDPAYRQVSQFIPEKNNQETFINVARLMDIGTGICSWVVSFQQLTIPQGPPPEDPDELEAFNSQKAQIEATIATINNNVVPMLKALRAIKTIATVSVNKPDHIEQTMVLKVEDL